MVFPWVSMKRIAVSFAGVSSRKTKVLASSFPDRRRTGSFAKPMAVLKKSAIIAENLKIDFIMSVFWIDE
jgi:hypothetical protein